ncbi:zinc-binding dehydrogenase [Nocardia brasiliensis]
MRRHLWPLVADGSVVPVIDAEVPVAEAGEAHRLLESGDAFGKLTLQIHKP